MGLSVCTGERKGGDGRLNVRFKQDEAGGFLGVDTGGIKNWRGMNVD